MRKHCNTFMSNMFFPVLNSLGSIKTILSEYLSFIGPPNISTYASNKGLVYSMFCLVPQYIDVNKQTNIFYHNIYISIPFHITTCYAKGGVLQKAANYPPLVDKCITLPPLIHLGKINKDHQRMMVDLMFMIVQSLRSILTTVTPTAVAPIAVIFTCMNMNLPEFI